VRSCGGAQQCVAVCSSIVRQCVAVRAAVCGSARGSVRQYAQQCIVCVWLFERKCAAVCQCGTMLHCAAVCGSAGSAAVRYCEQQYVAVCDSARNSVRRCSSAAVQSVRQLVWQCEQQCEAVCGNVRQCAAIRQCNSVCGSAAACGSARENVWRMCGGEWRCVFVCVSLLCVVLFVLVQSNKVEFELS
jgi:hypothetical protein